MMAAISAIVAFLILCVHGCYLNGKDTKLGRCLDCHKPIHTLHNVPFGKRHCKCAWKVYPPK